MGDFIKRPLGDGTNQLSTKRRSLSSHGLCVGRDASPAEMQFFLLITKQKRREIHVYFLEIFFPPNKMHVRGFSASAAGLRVVSPTSGAARSPRAARPHCVATSRGWTWSSGRKKDRTLQGWAWGSQRKWPALLGMQGKKGKRQKEQFQAKLLNSSWEDAPPLESWAIKNVLLFSLPEGTG